MTRISILVLGLLAASANASIGSFNTYSSSVVHSAGDGFVPPFARQVTGPGPVPVPGPTPGPHGDACALIIPGPGHSAAFDHALNVFAGPHSAAPGYSGKDTCISFDAINAAFDKATQMYGLRPKLHEVEVEDVGRLGMALTFVAEYIARMYNLPKDAIASGLPLIDTSKTIIGPYCPAFLNGYDRCEVTRYRTINGMCNNLEFPHWGSARNTFRRLLAPNYADGVNAPRAGSAGYPLPSPRHVSAHLHKDLGHHDHAVTMFLVSWGQVIDHDITFTGEMKPEEKDRNGRPKMPDCCNDPRHADNPQCFPIEIPADDEFYGLYGQKCMNVIRSLPGVHHKCKLGPRDPINTVSSYIDASFVYGSDEKTARRMRSYQGGLLKTLPVFREFGLKDLLPPNLHAPDEGCIRPSKDIFCFDAGDGRVNEQLVLAITQTMFVREHNRIAYQLAHINPHWDDETIYQETRLIVGALVQQVTYNEFLPMVLGKEVMSKNGMVLEKGGYNHKYDPTVDASASNAFASAAFRFGHSLLPSTIERWSVTGKYIDSSRLSQQLRQPYDIYKGGFCDQYTMGLMNQAAQAMDDAVSQEVTNHLFQMPEHRFGMDLAAINMQRGREHGIPGYNDYREYCGLPRIRDFYELNSVMTNSTASSYGNIYQHPDDIDLWSGGISEKPLPGSMVGPTLACLIAEQFRVLKFGDRFWFENQGFPSSFTHEQIDEIRKIKLSSVICANGDHIERAQLYVMVLPDHEINPITPCAALPQLDLSKWKDLGGPGYGPGPAIGPVYDTKSPQQVMFVVPPSKAHRPQSYQTPIYVPRPQYGYQTTPPQYGASKTDPHSLVHGQSFGESRPSAEYGAPQPQQSYGPPPKQEYGPPPKQEYGPPPKQEYTPPKQEYGPPPKQEYGPPPKQEYGVPKQVYTPPKQEYGPPPKQEYGVPKPQESYGAPAKLQESYGAPQPQESYGPPPSQEYGPPPSQEYGPPPQPHGRPRGYGRSRPHGRQPCCQSPWRPIIHRRPRY
ncbi:peroxidase-like isoform X1 [Amphibalanus amphitrite]|uniref:peroxidase-like isoform X1 n=1 Tax=Amphibalanus amphitrite TaxID=1232801 RepID=UPI001C91A230|nr:peroxidase-like isoform X1 [Amphibalanus amphitrite]